MTGEGASLSSRDALGQVLLLRGSVPARDPPAPLGLRVGKPGAVQGAACWAGICFTSYRACK